ncbi:MAG: alpha-2-macroglobulin [Acidobacteriota bacterium]
MNNNTDKSLVFIAGFVPLFILILLLLSSLNSLSSVDNPFEKELSKRIGPSLKKLYDEQKYMEALEKVKALKEESYKKGDVGYYTYYLIEQFKLESSLHAYETALKNFIGAKKPEHPVAKIILKLYETDALNNYLHAYSYEIMKREKISEKDELDFDKYTKEELTEKIRSAYLEVFKEREKIEGIPLESLPDFINSGNFPKQVLANFRDFAAISVANFFSSNQYFSPVESRTAYNLKVDDLLNRDNLASNLETIISSPSSHPLLIAAAALAEEEKHAFSKDRKSTAIEFHTRRSELIFYNLTQKEDRLKIIEELKTFLEKNKDVDWYSWGMEQAAQFERNLGDEECQIRAKELAVKGRDAYPNSPGGQRCKHLINSIEEKDFNIETMHSDGTNLPSVRITYKNLDKVFIRLIPVDIKDLIYKYNEIPRWNDLFKIVKDIPPSKKIEIKLKPTPDYNYHNAFVNIPQDVPKGYYICAASALDTLNENQNKVQGCFLNITETVLIISKEKKGDKLIINTLRGDNGSPINGESVSVIKTEWNKAPSIVFSGTTNEDGKIEIDSSKVPYYYNYYLFAQKGDDKAFMNIYPVNESGNYETNSSLIFTDRSVYRVGQKIFFKVILFANSGEKGPYSLLKNRDVDIELKDSNYESVQKISLKTNNYGSASGEFVIPKGRMLGRWQIVSSYSGTSSILVEEYKRPTFEVEIKEPISPLRLNSEAKIKGEAKYYFGMAVTSGNVDYTVTRIPRFPWWCWWYSSFSQPEMIESGTTQVESDGTFTILFTPEADERLKDQKGITYTYAVSANVTDEGGETRGDEKRFNIGFSTVEPSVSPLKQFFSEKEKLSFDFSLKDLNGNPQKGKGIYSIYTVEPFNETPLPQNFTIKKEKTKYSNDEDFIKPRWDNPESFDKFLSLLKTSKMVKQGEVEFDEEGKCSLETASLQKGIYRIKIEVKDTFGQPSENFKDFFVTEDGASLNLPLVLLSDKKNYEVNETAQILVYSGYQDSDITLRFCDKRGIVRNEKIKGGKVSVIKYPVLDESRGGIIIDASMVKNYTFFSERISLSVPYTNKELAIKFENFRERITPNIKESWKIKIVSPNGEAAKKNAVEVLASMYDKSLDIFAKHDFPQFMNLFPRSYSPPAPQKSILRGENLFTFERDFYKYIPYPTFNEPSLKSISGYGIGGPGRRYYTSAKRAKGEVYDESAIEGGVLGGVVAPAPAPAMAAEKTAPQEADKENKLEESSSKDGKGETGQIRENFAETPFFYPHLLTEADGSVSIEFVPPDSLTKYKFMLFAHGEGIVSGKSEKDVEAAKDFMVRSYLPRFLREGDEISIKVMVNNTFNKEIESKIVLKITDAESGSEITSSFSPDSKSKTVRVKSKKSETTFFSLKVPKKIQEVKFEISGSYENFVDGERKPLPVLPSRIHLAESKFVTLKENETREIVFEDLLTPTDKTRINEKMVLTVDAQLLYSVLEAMPYLVEYPYECTEQLANKFFAVGILNRIIKDNPSLEKFAREFSQRETKYEKFYGDDPNRRMVLEETPWLIESKGGDSDNPIIPILNPDVSRMVEQTSLKKLLDAQYPSGGFPWWAGGRPSPYITLYIVYAFSKAAEFGVNVPQENIKKAFTYLKNEGLKNDIDWCIAHDTGWEFITFMNYVLSNYNNPEIYKHAFSESYRNKLADFSFKHWKSHSPYLKLQLALTLKRMKREKDALLVHESVFDSAITRKDEGTFWMIEDKSWLWYNDTVETQAFALKELMEINPKDEKNEGLLLWLFLNKKLNHWKSTKATAEALYSILSYLKSKGAIAVKESIKIKAGDSFEKELVFEPEKYTGKKNQIVFEQNEITSDMGKIEFHKEGRGFAFASATLHFSTEELPAQSKGDFFNIERTFFKRVKQGNEFVLEPINQNTIVQVGDQIEVELKIKSKHPAEYIHIRAPRPSGCEPERLKSGWVWTLGLYYYETVRDSAEDFFIEDIPQGEFKLKYRLRCQQSGKFKTAPATIQSMYAPEFVAYSSGKEVKIEEKK